MADATPRRRRGDTRVFVYGSLRRGCVNHHLLAGARFVGDDRTPARFTMVSFGAFPAVVAGGATAILGEVFDVDAPMLAALDLLEGHPRWYVRTPVVLASGRRAALYVMPAAGARGRAVIASGDWTAPSARR